MKNKVVIIGCGNVGMSYAYALLNQRTAVSELVLIDINKDKAIGEAMDLNHCLAFAPTKIDIKAGDYSDCKDAKIVAIAAGANQDIGETRMDLIEKNNKVFESIIKQVMDASFKGIFLVATNPVDVMSYITWKHSKTQPEKVIGTGTTLDTARLRYEISKEININTKNIHAYVLGEHGNSQFVYYNNANISMSSIKNYLSKEERDELASLTKKMGSLIVSNKGYTSFGVASCLLELTKTILNDSRKIYPVSHYQSDYDLYFSMPAVIGKSGIIKTVPVKLSEEEKKQLVMVTKVLKSAVDEVVPPELY